MRFHLALLAAKITAAAIRVVAKGRGTNLPGEMALKIDPLFVSHIRGVDPEKAVFITGTNGKSTTTNLLNHILTDAGWRVCSNLSGANLLAGVATAMAGDATLGGRLRADAVVMETDERYLSMIRKQLPAKYICITNIQKDQAQRNGEPSFIMRRLSEVLDETVTLFTNQNESNSYSLKELAGKAIRYGVAENSRSFTKEDDFFAVGRPCPKCHNPIEFQTYNIDNIGPFRCSRCGFGDDGVPDYLAEHIDYEKKTFEIHGVTYPMNFATPYFLYCYTSAIAMAETLGLSTSEIQGALERFTNIRGRLVTKEVHGKTLKYIKMKQENSETLQSSLDLVAEDPGDKAFMIGYDEYLDFYPPFTNTFYLFDCDLRGLRRSGVSKWVCMSTAMGRAGAIRFLYDGFDPKDMIVLPDSYAPTVTEAVAKLDTDNVYLIEEIPYFKKGK